MRKNKVKSVAMLIGGYITGRLLSKPLAMLYNKVKKPNTAYDPFAYLGPWKSEVQEQEVEVLYGDTETTNVYYYITLTKDNFMPLYRYYEAFDEPAVFWAGLYYKAGDGNKYADWTDLSCPKDIHFLREHISLAEDYHETEVVLLVAVM